MLGVTKTLGDAAQALDRGGKAPREDDWADFLAIIFGLASMWFIWWLTTGMPISRDERRQLELEDDEAEGLARPAARILARSALNESHGHHVHSMAEVAIMAVVLTSYAERVSPLVRRKLEHEREVRRTRRAQGRERRPRVIREEEEVNDGREQHVAPASFAGFPLGQQFT